MSRRLAKGQVLFEAGDPSLGVFVLLSGRAQLAHVRPDGSVRAVCVVTAGDTFCCLPAMDGGPYPATATAAAPTTVLEIPGALFRELLQREAAFARDALVHFCGRIRSAACESCGVLDEVPARLASRLLQLDEKFGGEIPLTRRELGELAHTTVETTIRVLKEFESRGWVELGRSRVRVLDRDALERRKEGKAAPRPIELRRVLGAPSADRRETA